MQAAKTAKDVLTTKIADLEWRKSQARTSADFKKIMAELDAANAAKVTAEAGYTAAVTAEAAARATKDAADVAATAAAQARAQGPQG